MNKYRVTLSLPVEAGDPLDAIRAFFDDLSDTSQEATFTVTQPNGTELLVNALPVGSDLGVTQ